MHIRCPRGWVERTPFLPMPWARMALARAASPAVVLRLALVAHRSCPARRGLESSVSAPRTPCIRSRTYIPRPSSRHNHNKFDLVHRQRRHNKCMYPPRTLAASHLGHEKVPGPSCEICPPPRLRSQHSLRTTTTPLPPKHPRRYGLVRCTSRH